VVDPSYWMPGVFDDLATMTGDPRWREIAATTVSLVAGATQGGMKLPSDWGQLSGSRLMATAAPDGSAAVQYGLDAQRIPIWFATSCSPRARSIAGGWWRALAAGDRSSALALGLDGSVIDGHSNPVPLLASAATARAAGDGASASSLTKQAAELSRTTPTYYGDAWLALSAGLWSGAITGCVPDRRP